MQFKAKISQLTLSTVYIALVGILLSSVLQPLLAEAQIAGAQAGSELVREVVLKESIAGNMFPKFIPPTPDKRLKAVITVYTSSIEETDSDPFTAASGKRVYDGMVANNCLKFGTKVKFPAIYGDKQFTVDDRMNARYGCHRFDIWLNTARKEARKFGVKRAEAQVYLVKKIAAGLEATELAAR